MTSVNDFFNFINSRICTYFPEVKNLTEACDRVQQIDSKVSCILKNKTSNLYETAKNAADLYNLRGELNIEAKCINENKDSTVAKILKGLHNLFKPSTNFNRYSESISLDSLKGKIGLAFNNRQNVLSLAPEIEELSSRQLLQPLAINDSIEGLSKAVNTLDEAIEKLEALKVAQRELPGRLEVLVQQKKVLEQRIGIISNHVEKLEEIGRAYFALDKPQETLKLKKQLKKDLKEAFAQYEKVIDAQEKLSKGKESVDQAVAELKTKIESSGEWKSLGEWQKASDDVTLQTEIVNSPEGFLRKETKVKEVANEKRIQLKTIHETLKPYKSLPNLSETFVAYAKRENQLNQDFPSDPRRKVKSLDKTVRDLSESLKQS
jgi:hypothetical protein